MSKIKSEKAKEALTKLKFNQANIDYCIANVVVNGSVYLDIANVVSIAETELTAHYEQQLHELRDRAVEVFTEFVTAFYHNDFTARMIEDFTQKLTEKQ